MIVHQGIPIERVSAASHVPVPRATIRDLPAGSARIPSRTASVVYRPQLQAPARPVHMVAQQVDARHPVIQHAPIAPVRTEQPSAFSRSGSAPAAAPRRPALESPKASPWSSGARPASSSQVPPAPRASQTAPAAPSGRAPQTYNWSGGGSPAPSPQIHSTPSAPQSAPAASPARAPQTSTWSSSAKPASSPQYPATSRASQPAPAVQSPKASPWSSSAKPASSPQSQPGSKTTQPAPTAASAQAAARPPVEWKQGARSAPGYRSDTGLPAYYSAHNPAQSSPAAAQSSQGQNTHVYPPKSARQAAEIHSLPPSDQHSSASASSSGKNLDSKSGKNQ